MYQHVCRLTSRAPQRGLSPFSPMQDKQSGRGGLGLQPPALGVRLPEELTGARHAVPSVYNRQSVRPLRLPPSPAITCPIGGAVPPSSSLCVKRGREIIEKREKSGQRSVRRPSGPPGSRGRG